MFLMETFACSSSVFTCLVSSTLLSSVRGGRGILIIFPVVTGLSPILALVIVCSISGINFSSQGDMANVCESSTEIFDS